MSSLDEYGGPQLGDGTQIWKISHNGVDSQPIHWHMYNVQVLNRVGWDGFIREPDLAEIGWKDTVRVSPLEDTIVAMRPVAVTVPFDVPDKIQPSNLRCRSETGSMTTGGFGDTQGDPVTVVNHLVNFSREYIGTAPSGMAG